MPIELITVSLLVALLALMIRLHRGLSVMSYIIICLLSAFIPFSLIAGIVFISHNANNPNDYRLVILFVIFLPLIYAALCPVSLKYRKDLTGTADNIDLM